MADTGKIFIYGVPGAGKTTVSIALQQKLGCPLVEADALRELAQKEKKEHEDPFVYVGTTEAFQRFGKPTKEHILKGLHAVRQHMAPYVLKEVAKYAGALVMEGAFLDPQRLAAYGRLLLVVTPDIQQHRAQYFAHREQDQKHLETFQTARVIQEYFIKEAKGYEVTRVENNKPVEDLLPRVLLHRT